MQEKEINALWWWVGLSVGLHTIVLATLALGWWDRSPASAPELAKVILLPEPTPSPVVTPPPPVPQPTPQVRRPEAPPPPPVQRPEPAPRPEPVVQQPQPVTPRRLYSRPAPALTQQLPSVPDLPTEASPSENTVPAAPAPVADPQPAAKLAPMAAPTPVPPAQKETGSGQVACSRCPHPAYPPNMRQQGIQGRVGLSVDVTPQGSVAGVTIRQSSGHAELDEAAIRAVQNWRFTSSSQGRQGLQVSVQFQLR